MAKRGRPPKVERTPKLEAEAARLAGLLWSQATIAQRLGIPLPTFKKWLADDVEFYTALARARGARLDGVVSALVALADDDEDKRIQLEAAKLILSRKANDDWGRKLDPPPVEETAGGRPDRIDLPGGLSLVVTPDAKPPDDAS